MAPYDVVGHAPPAMAPIELRPAGTAAELAAEALAMCAHTKRKGFGNEVLACKPCTLVVLHGRRAYLEGRALPTNADPVCRLLVDIMADGGPRTLAQPDDETSLLAEVNRRRAEARQTPYSAAALSARLRELPGYGYPYVKGNQGRQRIYRMVVPDE